MRRSFLDRRGKARCRDRHSPRLRAAHREQARAEYPPQGRRAEPACRRPSGPRVARPPACRRRVGGRSCAAAGGARAAGFRKRGRAALSSADRPEADTPPMRGAALDRAGEPGRRDCTPDRPGTQKREQDGLGDPQKTARGKPSHRGEHRTPLAAATRATAPAAVPRSVNGARELAPALEAPARDRALQFPRRHHAHGTLPRAARHRGWVCDRAVRRGRVASALAPVARRGVSSSP